MEFTRFKEYYWMLRGHSLSIYARSSGKKRTSLYISQERGDHYYIQTRQNDLFCPLQSFFQENLMKTQPRKARVNTERVYWIVLMPPEYPIILLKSNKFNMAGVSVKMSIEMFSTFSSLDISAFFDECGVSNIIAHQRFYTGRPQSIFEFLCRDFFP